MKRQQGFTLIELMIALVLGLLVTAAVMQVFIISSRTAVVQEAGSSILDANVFGLQVIEKNIRMAGLGLADISKGNTVYSGIVAGNDISAMAGITPFAVNQLSGDGAVATTTNTSSGGSDQLTIQYRAPMDMRDCEGNLALGPKMGVVDVDGNDAGPIDGQVIVERYFVQVNGDTLELRCDAGRYVPEVIFEYHLNNPSADATAASTPFVGPANSKRLVDFGDSGQVIISGIDDFQIKFGVANDAGNDRGIEFLTPTDYNQAGNIDKAIVAVQIGLLAKGSFVTNEAPVNPSYSILGQDVTMKAGQGRFIRRVYETTVMLRNSRDRS